MSATLYTNELNTLIADSKRKNADLRSAAERALQELKTLSVTSEQQLAADLSRRPTFIEPFLRACGTGNAKLAVSGVNGLQRLVISRGLPTQRLDETLQAFNACTELGLDVQLKVLQALPSLVENYSEELRDDLLGAALQVCATLQGAKVMTVSAVAAATLQQLVTSVFDRLAEEDSHASDTPTITEVPGDDGPIALRPAAFDAYRVFRDLLLATEGRKTRFVQLGALNTDATLDLVRSCIEAKPQLINTHQELSSIVRSSVMPLITTSISEKLTFATTVRSIRILSLIITRHFNKFTPECEVAMGLFSHALEAEASPLWKRVLLMEALRDIFTEQNVIVAAYSALDAEGGGKTILQDILASLVRLSSEKPAAIGLGQQSTTPVGHPTQRDQGAAEQVTLDSMSGVAGVLSSLGVAEMNVQGISAQWSIPRTPCMEQLDKSEAPAIPETYIYSLVLECLNGLSDNLARVILPLTVQQDRPAERRRRDGSDADDLPSNIGMTRLTRSQSFRKRTVPLNPLDTDHGKMTVRVKAVAGLIEKCWPAVLATCSTFMNAALDDGYYRTLIKSYQRFTQVAGLLRLNTPRDALMTTLGKAAVPPQVLVAAVSETVRTPTADSPRVISNPRNLLSVESIVSQASSSHSSERDRRSSIDHVKPVLTVRNLLCLRALLNLAIALGPTLGEAFAVVMDVVKQADIILRVAGPQQMARLTTSSQRNSDSPAIVQAFSAEVTAVEGAASRLLESTADYPNDAFLVVLDTFCRMLHGKSQVSTMSAIAEEPNTPSSPPMKQRKFSGLPGISSGAEMQGRDYQFALPKLGTLAELNVSRFVTEDRDESGWARLTEELLTIATNNSSPTTARRSATDLLCRLGAECISAVSQEDEEGRAAIQRRAFSLLLRVIDGIYAEDGELTKTDLEVQAHVIDSLKAILDRSGDTIIAGWDTFVAITSSVFESEKGLAVSNDEQSTQIDWAQISNEFIALRLGRDAFAAIQLMCSDFLSLVPIYMMSDLIEILYRFISQPEDLNLSLTAITIAWNLSDKLFDTSIGDTVEALHADKNDPLALQEKLSETAKHSKPAQWLLLLIKLRRVVHLGQREAGKAAFQTICSICQTHGAQLPPVVWELLLRHVLIGVLADDAGSSDWSERSLTAQLLRGISETLAQNVSTIASIAHLENVWSLLIQTLNTLLGREDLETSSAVYRAMATVFAEIETQDKQWEKPIAQTSRLWSSKAPARVSPKQSRESNQEAFCAYSDLATQLARLVGERLTAEQADSLVANLSDCVEMSDASYRNADIHAITSLQAKVLDLFKGMRPQLVPSSLISAAAGFAMLHASKVNFDRRPSFVALGAESISWLQSLLLVHANEKRVAHVQGLGTGITCLADLIEEKYHFKSEYKGSRLWQRATSAAVTLAEAVLALADKLDEKDPTRSLLWREYVRIICNVVQANGLGSFDDTARIYQDEQSDIDAFKKLRAILVPRLGAAQLPDEIRSKYTVSLFEASIIHPTEKGETQDGKRSPLDGLRTIRRGRMKEISPSSRESMSYECLSELFALSAESGGSKERGRLARAAAPLFILRLAIPIRAYIADQPLRGRMPQPMSELEELLHCFKQIQTLELDREALSVDRNATAIGSGKAHLQLLYPLLAQAVGVAGNRRCGADEVLEPLQALLKSIEW